MYASTLILFGTDSNFYLTTLFRKARPLVDLISTDISHTFFAKYFEWACYRKCEQGIPED
jgi:hypothetical protein